MNSPQIDQPTEIAELNELEQELGALRYRCNPPHVEISTRDKVASWFFLLIPSFFLSMMIFVPLLDWLNAPIVILRIVVGVVTFPIASMILYAVLAHKNKDYLCLFDDGFATRIGWKKRRFRFDEVQQIGFGQLLTKLERKLQGIGYLAFVVKPSIKAIHDESAKNMITVILKSGKRIFVRGILVKFEKEQVRDFFRILLEEHPQLWEPACD